MGDWNRDTQTTNGGPVGTAIATYLVFRARPVKNRARVRPGSTLARHQVDRRVLASSIDLDIELNRVAFVQFAHA